jgi:PAS domain S-box-containing protein
MRQYKNIFESLIDLLEHPAWVKDLDGYYVYVNQAFLQFMGVERDDVLGKQDNELWPFLIAEIIKASDQKTIQFGEKVCFDEHYPDQDGNMTFFTSCKTVVASETGESLYTVGMVTSLSALEKLEEENSTLRENLEESDIALRAILDLRQRDKKSMENRTADALRGTVLPYLKKMQQGHLDSIQSLLLDTVIGNIDSLMINHSPGMDNVFLNLTPAEMQVAKFIRSGLSGKEIAAQLCLSLSTINTHRRNIRKRLGLNKKKTNLRQFLLAQ